MRIKSQKLRVWLISLGAVLVIYLFYNLISNTPSIEIDKATESADIADDVEFDSEIGLVGDVGVGTVRKAKYAHLNEDKQIDREFGFEKLLHVEGDEWEIEDPYMNIYRHNFRCYMTADRGKVRVEDAVGRATPRDATLSGNVVIHILPEENSNVEEGFIYLDDIIFISEKSQFSSDGPVKFTSQSAQMFGKGLEIIYNEELGHLEFLKIIELESLHIRQSQGAALFSSEVKDTDSAGSRAQTGVSADDQQMIEKKTIDNKKGDYYRCAFRGNVIIDSTEQLVFADEVSINNILWSKGPNRRAEDKGESGGGPDKIKTDAGITEESDIQPQDEPNEMPGQFVDIVVTCDNGILIEPMDSAGTAQNTTAAESNNPRSFDNEDKRPTFVTQKIDYCVVTEDTVASGLSKLTFYVNDVIDAEGRQTPVPVEVTSREKARFLPALNQVVFEGDALCKMRRNDYGIQKKYMLSGPTLTVDLTKDAQSAASSANIEHLAVSGGGVRLATVKTAESELIGGVELKCIRFDYDTGEQLFLATGPGGVIKVDNSNIAEPEKKPDKKFSLQKRCYAVVRNFDTLKYYLETNQIIADAGGEGIFIDYFPIVKEKYGRQVAVTASHIEALLYETADGRTELSTLSATDGITYEEEGKKNIWGQRKDIQFVGSEMFYDADESMITARGDESQPCLFNGALVDGIQYDLKSGKVETRITAPGMLGL